MLADFVAYLGGLGKCAGTRGWSDPAPAHPPSCRPQVKTLLSPRLRSRVQYPLAEFISLKVFRMHVSFGHLQPATVPLPNAALCERASCSSEPVTASLLPQDEQCLVAAYAYCPSLEIFLALVYSPVQLLIIQELLDRPSRNSPIFLLDKRGSTALL